MYGKDLHVPKILLYVWLFHLFQIWKNKTVAAQEKLSSQEPPILLSKDIEMKLSLLDREVNYLLNKAKFAKPKAKAKAKNSTTTEKSSKANGTAEDSDTPPTEKSPELNPGGKTVFTFMQWCKDLFLNHYIYLYICYAFHFFIECY